VPSMAKTPPPTRNCDKPPALWRAEYRINAGSN
jgi:hypothetical protein